MERGEMERLSEGLDLRLLLGILNSRMGLALLNEIRGGDFNIYPEHLRAIPVPETTATTATTRTNGTAGTNGTNGRRRVAEVPEVAEVPSSTAAAAAASPAAEIAALVDRILAAKKANPAANTAELESEIDALVYKLYGLTEEEIKVVEGKEREGVVAERQLQNSGLGVARPRQGGGRRNARPASPPQYGDDEVLE